MVASLYGSYDTTHLDVVLHGPGNDGTHAAEVDVYASLGPVPYPKDARWDCVVFAGTVCQHAHIVFQGDRVANNSDYELKSLACHEVGHSVGLLHQDRNRGESIPSSAYECMTATPSSDLVGVHNVSHINAFYP